MVAAYTDGKERHVTDEVLWRKDGTSFSIEYTSTPITMNGELAGAVVSFRDVTRRKVAEEKLRQSQELLSVEIENIADGLVLCDAENRVVLSNRKIALLYSNSRDAIFPGARFEDFIRAGAERGEYPDALEDADAWVAIMKTHLDIGVDILNGHEAEPMRMARVIALTHHEKWDGSGYPNGLKGADIPIEGRISALCDVFDALTSKRPYKNAWHVEEAVAYIRENAGVHFDPDLVAKFNEVLPDILRIRENYADED
jgi:PAS domain-containing protein